MPTLKRNTFPGSPAYVLVAADSFGHDAISPATRFAQSGTPAVSIVSNLVCQALGHDTPPADCVRRVREIVTGMEIAAAAARLMLEEIDPPGSGGQPE